ncbi:MAG: hypothetical protein KJN78_04370 [Gammaproteobacteria bacterium]|nr:hypothetical protein [Gammaproteobacteria bacterium]
MGLAGAQLVQAADIAWDMVDGTSQNLTSYSNPWTDAFGSAGDGFQKYQRGVSPSIPFAVLDDSLVIFPADSLGIVKDGNVNEFFGIVDTENGDNAGAVSATWEFDVSGATGLALSIEMGAMGDFESSDFFEWTYSIDGGPDLVAFASTVDEEGANTYVLEGGASFTLSDPMLVQDTILTDDLAAFSAPLTGSGSVLTLTLTAQFNGGTEAVVFQDIVISESGVPPDASAFDMVGSESQNLVAYTNPWTDAFGSAGDGFQKYRRNVSASIPFAVADDSLSIFPADSQGIIKEVNQDEFFGIVDTVNGDTSDPVSATWEFDVSGLGGLELSIDMGAMGDFESSDFFEWTYSIDGGPDLVAFASSVDENGSFTYTLEGGASFTLSDPMLMQGTILSNDLATFSTPLTGSGSTLSLTLTAQFNGGSEAVAFQNIVITEGDGPPPTPELEIYEIQGDGPSSPVEGSIVSTMDNVVTTLAPDGFFIQTPNERSDNDVNTSDGVFVFTGAPPGVAVGDVVDVTGEVDEFFGFTEMKNAEVSVDGSAALPDAVAFNGATPSPDPLAPSCLIEFECYEGMLIDIAEGAVSGPNQRFSSDLVAEVYIVAGTPRAFREPGIEYPGEFGYPEWDGNPEVFELDPDKLGLPNQVIPAGSTFSAVGVLGFEFGGYELWPSSLTVQAAPLPDPVRESLEGEMTVGTLNLFRLFDDVDDAPDIAADGRERDDFVVSTTEYARRLAKLSEHIVRVLDAPDILAVQEVESLTVMEDLAIAIGVVDSEVQYSAYLVEGNDVGTIDVGFLTRQRIQVDAITQLGKDEFYTNPVTGEEEILHDRPPLLLEGSYQLEFGAFPISVMTVHNRSLGSIDSPSEGPRVRQKRYQQAVSIAQKVQATQEADPDVRLIVTGDFNAFEFTDGYVDGVGIIQGLYNPAENLVCETNDCPDLVQPDLTNEVQGVAALDRYSFIFRGSAQVLDHALTSTGLAEEVTGAEFGRGNADAAIDLINDGSAANLPLRSSDHDGLVVYVLNDEDADGVPNDNDACPGTSIPESIPSTALGINRFALTDGDGVFDTALPEGEGPGAQFTVGDTGGCSCEQIVAEQGLGKGHLKFGCSIGEMEEWIEMIAVP